MAVEGGGPLPLLLFLGLGNYLASLCVISLFTQLGIFKFEIETFYPVSLYTWNQLKWIQMRSE